MPFGLKDNDYKLIKNVFHSISKIEEVIVFGSRAMGTEKPGSDVDLALKGNDITLNDILKLKHQLEELPIIYDFDVINYHTINTPALTEHIDRHGILFYKKEQCQSEWFTYKVKELVELGILERPMDGNHGEIHPKSSDFVSEGIPFIMATDIKNNKLDLSNCSFIRKEQADKLRKGFSLTGDVLLTHKASIGRTAIVPKLESEYIMLTPQVTFYRILDTSKLNNEFLKHYFNSSTFQQIINSYANSGSTRAYIGITEQLNLPILLPPIENQRSIAQILTSLDDKIELNLQMNQTLEAMAQTIFKEWFVDFKFPGFDGELEDGLPKGWRKEPLDEKISFLNGLALQKFPPKNETDYLPVIKIKELKQGISETSDKASTDIEKKYIIEDGDILFSWSGSLEVVMWCNGKGALNQHLFKVSSEKYPKWFYYYWTKEFLPIFQATAADKATTMGHIQRRHLTESLINVPDKYTLKLANEIIEPLLERIKSNAIQIQTLIQTRDSLLPRLMSGKIKI